MKIKKPVEIKNFAKIVLFLSKTFPPVLLPITFMTGFIFKIEIICFTFQNKF